MQIEIGTTALLGFLLASIRAGAWIALAPPFSTRSFPSTVKALLAAALALPVAPRVAASLTHHPAPAEILGSAAMQAAIGAALGFLTMLVFAAVQAAGDLIDLFGGFSLAAAFDPLSQSTNSVFGRFYQLLATVLLFTTGGHLLIVRGFMRTYDTLPLGKGLPLGRLAELIMHDFGIFLLAAVQVSAPLLGVLFLADAGLALLTRIAPALNAFSMSFPVKIMTTLSLAGLVLPLLPHTVKYLSDVITRSLVGLGG